MDQQTIDQIVQQIIDGTATNNLLIWGLQFSLWLLGSVAIAFGAAYLTKRGQHFATKADFDDLKKQLKETTEVAEQVKTEIAHADWSEREWKTIRRTKLEELMQLINETIVTVKEWLPKAINCQLNSTDTPLDRFQTIATLYFDELQSSTNLFAYEVREYFRDCTLAQKEIDHAASGSAQYERKVFHTEVLTKKFEEVMKKARALRSETPALMKYIMDVGPMPQPAIQP